MATPVKVPRIQGSRLQSPISEYYCEVYGADACNNYDQIWKRFDPDGSQCIGYDKLCDFIDALEPPLQIHKPNKYKIVALDIPIYPGNLVHCEEVLDQLILDFFAREGDPIDEMFEDAAAGSTGREPVSSTLWRQREEFSARVIQKGWMHHKTGQVEPVLVTEETVKI